MSTEFVIIVDEVSTTSSPEGLSSTEPAWSVVSDGGTTTVLGELATAENVNNVTMYPKQSSSETPLTFSMFQSFHIIEIIMTALELFILVLAALKLERWRKNYRNQMLMQLSIVRLIKRVLVLVVFLRNSGLIGNSEALQVSLIGLQIYVDLVIVILVVFFIKHMHDTLIVVVTKVSQTRLVRVVAAAWAAPVPAGAAAAALAAAGAVSQRALYLAVCAIFRWPLMLLGTALYIFILYKVFTEQIRKFARSLTVITFLLCLAINVNLFSTDAIYLFCINSFTTQLVSYVSGFVMNFLILCLYITLIVMNFRCKSATKCNDLP